MEPTLVASPYPADGGAFFLPDAGNKDSERGKTVNLDVIHQGDVLECLREFPDGIAQTVVTSPPYWGLRDYGVPGQIGLEKTPEEYVARMVEVFREVRRVLKDDGTLWLNLGDSFCSGGRATWRSGASQNKGQDVLNDMRRPEQPSNLKPKDLIGIPWRVAFALQADGWYLRSDIIWHKPNPMPESVTDRPTKSHEYLFLMAKNESYYYDAEAIREKMVTNDMRRPYGSPGANALDPRKKQGEGKLRTKKPDGWATHDGGHGSFHKDGREHGGPGEMREGRNKRTVWTVPTRPFPEGHFATFPEKLIEPCILAGSRPHDIVLDPFMGAGTTALVAAKLNRHFLGIEINPEYIKIAERRIAAEVAQGKFSL